MIQSPEDDYSKKKRFENRPRLRVRRWVSSLSITSQIKDYRHVTFPMAGVAAAAAAAAKAEACWNIRVLYPETPVEHVLMAHAKAAGRPNERISKG
ncbi:MAG: hypothetical protein INR71_02320 [Terriglobus roseus]|nr:hypothetical protein [Terriglobus roseus]